MQYVDPYQIDQKQVRITEREKIEKAIRVLNSAMDKIDWQMLELYRKQDNLPRPDYLDNDDAYNMSETHYENAYEAIEFKLERLSKRFDVMAQTVWELEERLEWGRY